MFRRRVRSGFYGGFGVFLFSFCRFFSIIVVEGFCVYLIVKDVVVYRCY